MEYKTHAPVLVEEIVQALEGRKIAIFVDATLGAGGHAKRILEAHPEIVRYIGIDADPEAIQLATENLSSWKKKVQIVHRNFEDVNDVLKEVGVEAIDGALFDLGVSSMQLDIGRRGFSFLQEGPLDMRMNPLQELDAKKIVNTWSEKELGELFREYGEDPRWRAAAKIIVEERKKGALTTTKQLAELLCHTLKTKIRGKLHPATLVFQALRMGVNRELEVVERAMKEILPKLSSQGVLAVISFHRLEDRIVKHVFKEATKRLKGCDVAPLFKLLVKKPLVPTLREVRMNPRARSAKLRLMERS